MPKTPGIRYFDSRGAYYTQFRGRQELLAKGPKDGPHGPTYAEACRRFAEVVTLPPSDRLTLNTIYVKYLHRLSAETRAVTEDRLGSFPHLGLRFEDLRTHHVQSWLDGKGSWGPTMKQMALARLKAVLNWALDQGVVARAHGVNWNKVEIPPALRRGRGHVLSPEEHLRVLAACRPALRLLLELLWATGCRPGEAVNARRCHYDPSARALVYRPDDPWYRHKTWRTGRDRVIYLTDDLDSHVRSRPHGLLWPTRSGRPWSAQNLSNCLGRARLKAGLDRPLIAYSYRHTFATHFLLSGRSIKVCAELLGTSVKMLERHYGHLEVDHGVLRAHLLALRAPSEPGEPGLTV